MILQRKAKAQHTDWALDTEGHVVRVPVASPDQEHNLKGWVAVMSRPGGSVFVRHGGGITASLARAKLYDTKAEAEQASAVLAATMPGTVHQGAAVKEDGTLLGLW
jgi:hypothetical protein